MAPGTGLCTIIGIEGSFSRRLGAQLAVAPDGTVTGSMADGCLERQLAAEVLTGGQESLGRRVMRFGAGSPLIDFRLPCGSGLDVLIDPTPDHAACAAAVAALDRRESGSLPLPLGPLSRRDYVPALRLLLFGEGPELEALALLGRTAGLVVETFSKDGGDALSLGTAPAHICVDPWSAVILLFHDHEWEQAILQWALGSPAFFIGAQGGHPARAERAERLARAGVAPADIARIASPIGVVRHSREPVALALSILASVVGAYEAVHPHA